jgi:hypothetical protein
LARNIREKNTRFWVKKKTSLKVSYVTYGWCL